MSDVAYLGVYDWETYFEGGDVGGGGSADLSAIAENVLPATDNAYDLGSQAKRWLDLWLGNILHLANNASVKAKNAAGDAEINLPYLDENDHTVLTDETGAMTWFIDHTNDWFGPGSLVGLAGGFTASTSVLSGADVIGNVNLHPKFVLNAQQLDPTGAYFQLAAPRATVDTQFYNSPRFEMIGSKWFGDTYNDQRIFFQVEESEFAEGNFRLAIFAGNNIGLRISETGLMLFENGDKIGQERAGIGFVNNADSAYLIGLQANANDLIEVGGVSSGVALPTIPTTTDPALDGALFTCTAAELAGLLGAGAKYVLISKGAP